GAISWGDFFDELEADLEFKFRGDKKTLTEVLYMLTKSKDADERAELSRVIARGLKGPFSKYAAQTLYMVVGDNSVENRERTFKHPMEPRNKSNRIQDEVVDALHNVVRDMGGPLMRRFYRLKAAHLGLKKLKWSDRNAPMPFADTTVVPFEKAMTTVLEAYESFSPTLAGLIRKSIEEKRIDAPAEKGRRAGAYNYSIVLPGNIPASFTFLNYFGSNRDVMVLAHELGHGVHGLLAGEAQGPLMFGAPTAYAETASVFGEMTTFNFLKKQLVAKGDKKSLLALVMSTIDDTVNTVVRQIGFSNFERRLHGMDASYIKWGEPKKHSVEEVSAIWLETLKDLYGEDGDIFTYEDANLLWSYVSHFHRPFYVYGYSIGQLLTQSLYAQQSRIGERFEPLYLDMLRSGSTKNAVELLEPFGLDPRDPKFWSDGIKVGLGALVQEAEDLSRELGISL
ncbi:MAG: M3 family metallopeptidase, partial [Patescibacteria group bacterium]